MRAVTLIVACVLIGVGWSLWHSGRMPGPSQVVADDEGVGVRAVLLSESTWDRFAPLGKEVDAIFGDIVLSNQHLTAVIAQPLPTRNANMTVREVAGCLIDLTGNHPQSDQLSCFYPGQRAFPFRSWTVTDADNQPIDLSSGPHRGRSVSVTVRAAGDASRPQVLTTYTLEDDSRWLTITTVYTNTSDAPLEVTLADDLRADGGRELMVKSPNGQGDYFYVADRFWGQAYGLVCTDRRMQFNSDNNRTDFRYLDPEGQSTTTLAPGQSLRLTRSWTAGPSPLHVAQAVAERQGVSSMPVPLQFIDANQRPISDAELTLLPQDEQNRLFTGVVRTDAEGAITVPLAVGDYHCELSFNGQNLLKEYVLSVSGEVSQREQVELGDFRSGELHVTVTDERGAPIPCKVDIAGLGETPTPYFGPDTAEFGVRNLRYAPQGEFTQLLHPGRYALIVSRGPEYDAVFAEVVVLEGEQTSWNCELVRSVDTAGWISSDFHSHSSPSGDNTSSQLGRVINLVCEHIEFAPCTEHNRVDSYQPHIDSLGIGEFLSSCSGIELTGRPLPLNHQNAFPLRYFPHRQDGGGPVTDDDPVTQVERLALWDDRSEKLIQQNHPDLGWLIFDRDGDGQYDDGYAGILPHIDVIEIHPVESALTLTPLQGERNDTLFNWLQMLNQGYRYPGVVNTDAHYNFHGSGWLRNWIRSPTDEPAEVNVMDIVRASEHGALVMSNGPFLEVMARVPGSDQLYHLGDLVEAPDREITLEIKVQCPNWVDVNRVFVLINGRRSETHDYSRESHPDMFGDGPVRFHHELAVSIEEDAHVIVVTGGEGLQLGPVMGPDMGKTPPAAITNPIWVDVDGGGWTPTLDTLDAPLPVRRS